MAVSTGDALRGLYLTVGVRAPGAVKTLDHLSGKFAQTAGAANQLFGVLEKLQGFFGKGAAATGGSNAFAQNVKGLSNEVKTLRREINNLPKKKTIQLNVTQSGAGAGGRGGMPGIVALGGRGGGGTPGGTFGNRQGFFARTLERSLFLGGVYGAGRVVLQQADADFETRRAASIMGITPAASAAERARLMRTTNLRISEASGLNLAVAQIGLRDPKQARELATASAMFNRAEPGFASSEAAKMAYRYAVATGAGQDKYTGIMSAILRAGDISPAGAEDVAQMLLSIQSSLTASGFKQREGIGLASALAGLDPYSREAARGSLMRVFTDKKLRAFTGQMAAAQGVDINNASGGATLLAAGRNLGGMTNPQKLAALSSISNVRDKKFFIDLSNSVDEYAENMAAAQEEMDNGGRYLATQMAIYTRSFKGQIDKGLSGLDLLGAQIVRVLGPVAGAAAVGIGATASGIAGSPVLTAALLGGAGLLMARNTRPGEAALRMFGIGRKSTAGVDPMDMWRMGYGSQGFAGTRPHALTAMQRRFGPGAGLARYSKLSARAAGVGLGGRIAGGRLVMAGTFGRPLGSVRGFGWLGGVARANIGRGLVRGGLGRAAGFLAGGPVGAVIAGVSLLQPVFGGLATMLQSIGQRGGVIGLLANSFAVLFRVLEGIGKGINFVIDGIMGMLSKFFNWGPIKRLFDWASGGVGWVANKLDFDGGGKKADYNFYVSQSVSNPAQANYAMASAVGTRGARNVAQTSYAVP